jgi:hypothetical protein
VEYTAEVDCGTATVRADSVSVGGEELVSKEVKEEQVSTTLSTEEKRKPLAFGFIVDCTGSITTSDPNNRRFAAPGELASHLNPDDLASFVVFNSSHPPYVCLDWTPGPDVGSKIPEGQVSTDPHDRGTLPSTSVDEIAIHFSSPEISGKDKVAVIVSDNEPPDDAYVLRTATRLKEMGGIKVYLLKFGYSPISPELRSICDASGGHAYETADMSGLSSLLSRMEKKVVPVVETHRKVVIHFRSTKPYALKDKMSVLIDGVPRDAVVTGSSK